MDIYEDHRTSRKQPRNSLVLYNLFVTIPKQTNKSCFRNSRLALFYLKSRIIRQVTRWLPKLRFQPNCQPTSNFLNARWRFSFGINPVLFEIGSKRAMAGAWLVLLVPIRDYGVCSMLFICTKVIFSWQVASYLQSCYYRPSYWHP